MCADGKRWAQWKAARLEVIDLWLPLWFDNTYVMPPVVAQKGRGFMYSTAQMTLRDDGKPLADGATPQGLQKWVSSDYTDAGLGAQMPPTGGPHTGDGSRHGHHRHGKRTQRASALEAFGALQAPGEEGEPEHEEEGEPAAFPAAALDMALDCDLTGECAEGR